MREWINMVSEGHETKYYIRFGDIPAGERSTVGAVPNIYSRSRPGDVEAGVSVFDTEWSDDLQRWQIVEVGNFASLDGVLGQKRPAFLVTGHFVGEGTDGEPLLRGVEIIEELPYDRMWVPAYGNDGACEEYLISYDEE